MTSKANGGVWRTILFKVLRKLGALLNVAMTTDAVIG
jgi:hypothetical protein